MTVEQFNLDFKAPVSGIHCTRCKKWVPALNFVTSKLKPTKNPTKATKCRDCWIFLNREKNRRAYAKNAAYYIQKNRKRTRAALETDAGKTAHNERKRKYRARLVESGLTTDGKPRKKTCKRTPEQVAFRAIEILYRKWYRNWLKTFAPAPCVAAIYAATGKPWNNPRLTIAEKFAMRYELDTEFRAREIIKTQSRKAKRAALIAAQSDGTVTPKTLGALFAAAKDCCYCGAPMNWKQKTADHIVPLTQGGQHSMTNLAICCISCNSAKRDRTPEQWLTSGLQKSRWTDLISSKRLTFSA